MSIKAADRFCGHVLWSEAIWTASTYRCHPTGDVPPVMGLVFADHEKGLQIFASWTNDWGNSDPDDSIRIAIIEGDIPGQMPGYTIRLSANDPDANGGQAQRMHPLPETEAMLVQFKTQYLQHGEFLLCPVVQKDDGQLWFNANAGIIKHQIIFRNTEDISADDVDAIALNTTPSEQALLEILTRLKSDVGEQK